MAFSFNPRCPKCGLLLALCAGVGAETLHAHHKTHEAKTDMGGTPHAPEEPTETPKPVSYYYTVSSTTTQPPTGYDYGG